MSTKINFSDWLQERMNERGLAQADLARKSGLSTATISRIMAGDRGVGLDACVGIGKALRIAPEDVFRAAVGIKKRSEDSERLNQISYYMELLDDFEKDDILAYAEMKVKQKQQKDQLTELRNMLIAISPERKSEALDLLVEYLKVQGVINSALRDRTNRE